MTDETQLQQPIKNRKIRELQDMTQAEMAAHAAEHLGLDIEIDGSGYLSNDDFRKFVTAVMKAGSGPYVDVDQRADRHANDPNLSDFRSDHLDE